MDDSMMDARAEELTVSAHWGRRQSYVRISGCLDGLAVGRAAELLLLSARHTRRLDLDLSAVRRLGPVGAQLLFDAQRTAARNGCLLRVVTASPAVDDVIAGTEWFRRADDADHRVVAS